MFQWAEEPLAKSIFTPEILFKVLIHFRPDMAKLRPTNLLFVSPNWNRSKYVTSESIKHDKMWKKAEKNFKPAARNEK